MTDTSIKFPQRTHRSCLPIKPKAILSWSSGKDSAYSLYEILRQRQFEVVGLLTTVTDTFERVSMHGVREELLDQQAASVDLPLHKIRIPSPCLNAVYEEKMAAYLTTVKKEGVEHIIFGDIFLEDLRKYREANLAKLGMYGVFPLWLRPTPLLARQMIRDGFQVIITCIDPKKLLRKFCGRRFNASFLADLPADIDPCGENGEFHTVVHGGPIFKKEIQLRIGETVNRDDFVFTDVLLERP